MTIALALLFGALIGTLLGLLGGGGSILAVPALVYAVGLDMGQAIPLSLIVIGVASAFGAVPKIRAGLVHWRLAAIFAASGIPATFAGAIGARLLPQRVLLIGFAIVMVAAGIRMFASTDRTGTAGDSVRTSRAILAGLLVGLLTGLFGVGGGFLIVPSLVVLLGVEMPVAVGTSLSVIVCNSAAGLAPHLHALHIDWAVAAAFVGTATLCSLIAAHLGTRTDTDRLHRWFAYLIFAVAAFVLIDTICLR